jgi:hypothetical protein
VTASLQIACYLLGAILNALLTYEAISKRGKWWKIAISGLTTIGLLVATLATAGLLNLQNI